MTGKKQNPNRPILRFWICDHGIVNFLLIYFVKVLPLATAQVRAPPPPPPPESNSLLGPQFNPAMAIVMVVLVSAFFLMGFFSVYVRRCADRRFPRSNDALIGGANHRSRRGSRGLDDSIISTFPTFLYSAVKGLKIGKGSLECAVCINEFEEEETLRLIPKCSHVFHMDCIDAWLASHSTCPVCRANLVPQPGESQTPSCFVQIFNQYTNTGTGIPEQSERSVHGEEISQIEQRREVESLDVNLINLQNRPRRSRSTGWRLSGIFPRSHSTGHSLVQHREDCEKFTLRLPEEVRNQLINSCLNRSKSCVVFPRVRSSRRGFRCRSEGRNFNFYERFDRPSRSGHWDLSLTPPFISRTGSVRYSKMAGEGSEVTCSPLKRFQSIKLPPDRLFSEDDRNGERSLDSLRPDNQA